MWPFKKRDARINHDFTAIERDKSHIAQLENQIRTQRIKFLKEKLQRLKANQEEYQLEAQISDLEEDLHKDDDDGDDEEEEGNPQVALNAMNNPDALLMQLLTTVLAGQTIKKPEAPPTGYGAGIPQVSPPKKHLTDDELRGMKRRIPAPYLKRLRKMSDEKIIEIGRQYAPDFFEQCDDDTIKRAVLIVKEKN
jgi:hypothetical protein